MLKNIIKITKTDYEVLVSSGSIVKGGVTYTYSPNTTLYLVDNGLTDDYVQLGAGGGKLLTEFMTKQDYAEDIELVKRDYCDRISTVSKSVSVAQATADSARSIANSARITANSARATAGSYTIMTSQTSLTLTRGGNHNVAIIPSSTTARTITLPAGSADGETFTIRRLYNGVSAAVTVKCDSGNSFQMGNGSTTYTYDTGYSLDTSLYRAVRFIFYSNKWYIVTDD